MRKLGWLVSAMVVVCPAVANAQEAPAGPVPPQYQAMLDDALATGSDAEVDAVAKFIKRAEPNSAGEVDKALAARKARRDADAEQARIAELERKRGLLAGWAGEGQLGAFMATGNSDTAGVAAGISLTKEGRRWRHNLRVLNDYQRSNGVTSRNQLVAAYEPNFKINSRMFVFGLAQYERDRFQGYSTRVSVSGGAGYRVIDTNAMTLDVKAGPAWRRTEFIDGTTTSRLTGLASLRYDWRISGSLTFKQSLDALVDSRSASLVSLSSLDAKLGGAFTTRLSYQVNHETSPPAGIKKTDTLSRITLVYGF